MWRGTDRAWYYTIQNSVYAAADQFVTYGPFLSASRAAEDIAEHAGTSWRCWLQHEWFALDVLPEICGAVSTAIKPLTWFVRERLPMRQRDRVCRYCGDLQLSLTEALLNFLDDMPLSAWDDEERRAQIWNAAPPQIGLTLS